MSLYEDYKKGQGIYKPITTADTQPAQTTGSAPQPVANLSLYEQYQQGVGIYQTPTAPVEAPIAPAPVDNPVESGDNSIGLFSPETLKLLPEEFIKTLGRGMTALSIGASKTIATVPLLAGDFNRAATKAENFIRAKAGVEKLPEEAKKGIDTRWEKYWTKVAGVIETELGAVYGRPQDPQQVSLPERFLESVGSSLPYYVIGKGVFSTLSQFMRHASPALISAFATGANATMTALEASQESAAVYDDLLKQGWSEKEARAQADKNWVANALVIYTTNRYGFASSAGRSVLKRVVMSAPNEAVQEALQQGFSNVATGRPFWENVLEAGAFGGAIGTMFGLAQPFASNPAQQQITEFVKNAGPQVRVFQEGGDPLSGRNQSQSVSPQERAMAKEIGDYIAEINPTKVPSLESLTKQINNKFPTLQNLPDQKLDVKIPGMPESVPHPLKQAVFNWIESARQTAAESTKLAAEEAVADTQPVEKTSTQGAVSEEELPPETTGELAPGQTDTQTTTEDTGHSLSGLISSNRNFYSLVTETATGVKVAGMEFKAGTIPPALFDGLVELKNHLPSTTFIQNAPNDALFASRENLINLQDSLADYLSDRVEPGELSRAQLVRLEQKVDNIIEDLQRQIDQKTNTVRPERPDRITTERLIRASKPEATRIIGQSELNLIDAAGEVLSKVANASRGLQRGVFMTKPSLLRGEGAGVITDGYVLVNKLSATQKIFQQLYKRRPQLAEAAAQTKEDFPDWKKIVPKGKGKKARLQGYTKRKDSDIVFAVLSDGKQQIFVDADKLAFMKQTLPEAEMFIYGERKPVVFKENGEVVGLLMPTDGGPVPKFNAEAGAFEVAAETPVVEVTPKTEVAEVETEAFKPLAPVKEMDGDFYLRRDESTAQAVDQIEPAKSPEELVARIEQLNKFAMANRIMRRGGGVKNPKAAGQFQPIKGKPGEVKLRNEVIKNDWQYMTVLAHELGHAIHHGVTGDTKGSVLPVFGELTAAEGKQIIEELKAVTNSLVGEGTAKKGAGYYYKQTELLARFFEKMMLSPKDSFGTLIDLAPLAVEKIELAQVSQPLVRDFLEAATGAIDKNTLKFKILRDKRELAQKYLGNRVGNIFYDETKVHAVMQARAVTELSKMVEGKMKGITDEPAQLFRAAESIKVTTNGVPEFGTRDFLTPKNGVEEVAAMTAGFKPVVSEGTQVQQEVSRPDGSVEMRPLFAKSRYTPAQAEAIFKSLSPKGQQLIKDFTAARDEAKDFFNREVVKDIHQINGNIEGWMHHIFPDTRPAGGKSLRFKNKTAGARKYRAGAEGYVEDFQQSITKALVELQSTKEFNKFVERALPMVTKPIAEGAKPEAGWVEVQGDLKKGLYRPGEKQVVIMKDGKQFLAKQTRYQMPTKIYEEFQIWKGATEEASKLMKVIDQLSRYWNINILFSGSSTATNAAGGALQYTDKVFTDFYTELLSGQVTFKQTRRNIFAIFTTLMPRGWQAAPDWIYGGDMSNYYGQFLTKGPVDTKIDQYGNVALKAFGLVERYFKKMILNAENIQTVKGLGEITPDGLKEITEMEREIIALVNSEVDLYAFDYDNIPPQLAAWNKNPLGRAIKPFATYPYKYFKLISGHVEAVFNRELPWQERAAKMAALATMMALFALWSERRNKQRQTPEATPNTPTAFDPAGRVFTGTDDQGRELFTRVSKYPFLNITQAGLDIIHGNKQEAINGLQNITGSVGPLGQVAAAVFGFKNKYQVFTPTSIVISDVAATYTPGYRLWTDIAKFFDPFQRKKTSPLQSFTGLIPTTSADLQNKLHGDIRYVGVPTEGRVNPQPGDSRRRTTTDLPIRNYQSDVILSALLGIFIQRIDPKAAEAFNLRSVEQEKEAQKNLLKEAKNEAAREARARNNL